MYIGWQSIAKLPNCQSFYIEGKHRHHEILVQNIQRYKPLSVASIWDDSRFTNYQSVICHLVRPINLFIGSKIILHVCIICERRGYFGLESWVWALSRVQIGHVMKMYLIRSCRGSGPKSQKISTVVQFIFWKN